MSLSLPQFFLSILLYAVLFFGIGFIVNMLLKTTWLMAIIYPIITILIIDQRSTLDYITEPGVAFAALGKRLASLAPSDYTVLLMGLVGALISGITIKMLRSRGYTMF